MINELPCTLCNGTGIKVHPSFKGPDGHFYPEQKYTCKGCNGKKTFKKPKNEEITNLIISSRGKNKGKLKFDRPESYLPHAKRAYYVWRMARFHSGKDKAAPDVTLSEIQGDPYIDILNQFVDKIVQEHIS